LGKGERGQVRFGTLRWTWLESKNQLGNFAGANDIRIKEERKSLIYIWQNRKSDMGKGITELIYELAFNWTFRFV
jgi:hypothetical protein